MISIAFITGITGQDGSYLTELLLEKGYFVHGLRRRASTLNTSRIDHLISNDHLELHYGDMTDMGSLINILNSILTKHSSNNIGRFEIYNLAAQSHVKVSFDQPEYTFEVNTIGTLKLLEAIRCVGLTKKCRFYQASTSEMFGGSPSPQSEKTIFDPKSPYAVSKVSAHQLVKLYRESYGMHACCGILFNHTSPRRGENFVTRKVSLGISKIANREIKYITLGNLDSMRDWGYALDYCKGMYSILQNNTPDDFVLAYGTHHSVREFVDEAFRVIGVEMVWIGEGVDEIGVNSNNGEVLVKIDPKYFRPSEVDDLLGDFSKAKSQLGWEPSVSFKDLVKMIVLSDLKAT